jgi:hypothetical protein
MGAAVSKGRIARDKNVVGATQPGGDAERDIGALRKEVDSLKAKVADAAKKVTSRAAGISQTAEGAVGLRTVSALLIAAATAVALLVSSATVAPRRSRYRRLIDDLQDRLADLRMLR